MDPERFHEQITRSPAALIYFSAPDCGVCHALKPKVQRLLREEFPRLQWLEVDIAAEPALAARYQVFTVPTVLVFFDGRESVRLSRGFAMGSLRDQVARPYGLRFQDE